ncbi:MAG: sensor histidine kinase [Alphaproteobacteria bacterium]
MGRFGFVWRVVLIVVLGLFAMQMVALGVYYAQRNRPIEGGFRLPLLGQVAALTELVERLPAEDRALALRAASGPGIVARIAADDPDADRPGPRLERIETALAERLRAPGRTVSARLLADRGPDAPSLRPLDRLAGDQVRITVTLAAGGFLVVDATGDLTVRILGLPAGWFAGLLGALIALAAAVAVLREIRPLSALARAVERFGVELRPTALPRRGAPEVRALTAAVERMQARIAALVQGRALMLAAIAHDLRTYLTRLRLRIEAIADDDRRAAAARDIADMEALLEDSLAVARASFAEPGDAVADLARVVARECEERVAMGEPVEAHLPDQPLRVRGTPAALSRVVANLVDNALKYGREAAVSLVAEDGRAVLRVDDRGPGVPASDRRTIFEPFHRLEPSRNRASGGAGLGLTICQQVVEGLGGTIAVGDRPGGGARFEVRLPLA